MLRFSPSHPISPALSGLAVVQALRGAALMEVKP